MLFVVPTAAEVICDVKPKALEAALVGRTIQAAKRRGKQVRAWVGCMGRGMPAGMETLHVVRCPC